MNEVVHTNYSRETVRTITFLRSDFSILLDLEKYSWKYSFKVHLRV